MSQKLPTFNFKWVEDTSQFNEDFIKNYNEKSEEGYFLEVHVQYLEKLYELHSYLTFLPERKKLKKGKKSVINLHGKILICYTHKKFKTSVKQWVNF